MLSPLTNLVEECGHTKTTKAAKAKRKPWLWDSVHETAFDNVETTIAKDVVLAYHDYTQETLIVLSFTWELSLCKAIGYWHGS